MKIDNLVKSPMNYTGGKYKLLYQILPLFPQKIEGRFIDLFCGGLDITINVDATKIVANDINTKVIEIYQEMKKYETEELISYIENKISEYSLTIENAEAYNKFRLYYNLNYYPIDLFILICYSFNHQIRFNKDGKFNMPFGKNRSYFNDKLKKNLISFHKIIKQDNILFTNLNFLLLKPEKLTENDFVYCDPPYLITCATYNEQDGWNETLEKQLYELLDKLNEKNIKFAVSNVLYNKGKENEILKEWCKKYNVYHLDKTYSNCSYHAIDRDKNSTDEVLVTNYDCLV